MATYRIVTESTTDLPGALMRQLDLTVIPMRFSIGGEEYADLPDGGAFALTDFYNRLRAGEASTTAAVNPFAFLETFERILQAGQDILYVAFSSGLSGTYNAALPVVAQLRERYPERDIRCVDTLAASMGEGLMAYHAARLRDEGKRLDENARWLLDNRLSLCQWFTVDDLHHLRRGGRVGAVAAYAGTMLGIKPVLHVDDEGHLIPVSKARGHHKAMQALCERMAELAVNPAEQTVFISHGDAEPFAEELAALLRERLGVRDIVIGPIGPVIGSHSGPGTVALFFLGSHR